MDNLSTYLLNNFFIILICLGCLLFGLYLIYLLLYNRFAKPKEAKLLLIRNKDGVLYKFAGCNNCNYSYKCKAKLKEKNVK